MTTACPDRILVLHALADGELDAMAEVALEAHLRGCAGCRAAFDEIMAVRAALGDAEARPTAPAALRARIEGLVAEAPPVRTERPARRIDWATFGGGGAVGALAASLALLLAVPQMAAPSLQDELVANHVRSLQANHLVDVVTSNRHVVKPWFNGRIDFAPPVADLVGQGFPLVGGRLDVVENRTVAALVYKRGLHRINLFIRPAAGPAAASGRPSRDRSYNLLSWRSGGLDYWAVSDMEASELVVFRDQFRAATRP